MKYKIYKIPYNKFKNKVFNKIINKIKILIIKMYQHTI
jgi:hypothetical protein